MKKIFTKSLVLAFILLFVLSIQGYGQIFQRAEKNGKAYNAGEFDYPLLTSNNDILLSLSFNKNSYIEKYIPNDLLISSSSSLKNQIYVGNEIKGETKDIIYINISGSNQVQKVSDFGFISDLSEPYILSQDSLAPQLTIDSKTAEPGDNIVLNIHLMNPKKLQESNVTKISAVLKFNSTLLEPLDQSNAVIRDDYYYLGLDLPVEPIDSIDIVKKLNFTATLGNAESTSLSFENIKAIPDQSVKTIGVPGVFTIDICKEGGSRLVSQKKKPSLKVNPNPAKNNAEIEYELFKAEKVNIIILDGLGQKVTTIISEDTDAGMKSKIINMDGFITGVYYIVLQAGAEMKTEKLYVVR
jgi:hypothetical protein